MIVVVGVALAVVAYVVAAAAMNRIRRPNLAPWIKAAGWVMLLGALGALVWFISARDSALLWAFLVTSLLLPVLHRGLLQIRGRQAHSS